MIFVTALQRNSFLTISFFYAFCRAEIQFAVGCIQLHTQYVTGACQMLHVKIETLKYGTKVILPPRRNCTL